VGLFATIIFTFIFLAFGLENLIFLYSGERPVIGTININDEGTTVHAGAKYVFLDFCSDLGGILFFFKLIGTFLVSSITKEKIMSLLV